MVKSETALKIFKIKERIMYELRAGSTIHFPRYK